MKKNLLKKIALQKAAEEAAEEEKRRQESANVYKRIVEDDLPHSDDPEEFLGLTQAMPAMTPRRMFFHRLFKKIFKK